MATNGPVPSWTIISQSEQWQKGPTGQFVNGVVVTFRLASGTVGSVFIPNAELTVATVAARIAQRAAVLGAVETLTGS